jgi:hypothetical protein
MEMRVFVIGLGWCLNFHLLIIKNLAAFDVAV